MIGAGIAGLAAASELRASGFGRRCRPRGPRPRRRAHLDGNTSAARFPSTSVPRGYTASAATRSPTSPAKAASRLAPTDWDNAVLHFHDRAAPRSDTPDLDGFWTLAETRPRASLRSILDEYLETHARSATQRRYLEHLLNTTVEHEYGADLADLSPSKVSTGAARTAAATSCSRADTVRSSTRWRTVSMSGSATP